MSTKTEPYRRQLAPLVASSLLFFQNGSFFNVYGPDAKVCHDVVGLHYTGGREEAGVPVHTVDAALATLVGAGHSVVLVRQIEDSNGMKQRLLRDPSGESRVRRVVASIHTPGTYDDGTEKTMFAVRCLEGPRYDLTIYNHLQRSRSHVTCPREDLHAYTVQHKPVEVLWHGPIDRFHDTVGRYVPNTVRRDVDGETSTAMLETFFRIVRQTTTTPLEKAAPPPLDAKTLENLRPLDCFQPETRGGQRLLAHWLRSPVQDLEEITARQDEVARYVTNPIERERQRQKLAAVRDTTFAKDLQDLRKLVVSSEATAFLLSGAGYLAKVNEKARRVFGVLRRMSTITGVRFESPDVSTARLPGPDLGDYREAMVRRLGQHWNREMDDLRLCSLDKYRFDVEVPIHHFQHVDQIIPPKGVRRSSQTKQVVRFTTARTEGLRCAYETRALAHRHQQSTQLRAALGTLLKQDLGLDRVYRLDALVAMADVAATQHWCRPVFGEDYVVEGAYRHKGDTPNDLPSWSSPIVLTGMNGSGKTTWMRALAHVTLLAQAGSFVPATKAVLPLVDHVFLRFGSQDNLLAGESSFQSEMRHALYIQRTATRRSLVFIDELGASCGAVEGEVIAQAVLRHYHRQHIRVVFATHFRGLVGTPYQMKQYHCEPGRAAESGAMAMYEKIFQEPKAI